MQLFDIIMGIIGETTQNKVREKLWITTIYLTKMN